MAKDTCPKCGHPKDVRAVNCADCSNRKVGKPKVCGTSAAYQAGCRCTLCRRANADAALAREKKDPERKRARDRRWLAANKDARNARRRRARFNSRDEVLGQERAQRQRRRAVEAALVRRRMVESGVLLDYEVDRPVRSRYLVYALIDPRTIAVRYVGVSSTGLDRPRTHATPSYLAKGYNKRKDDWIRSLQAAGLKYAIRVLEYFDTPEAAHDAEPYWIQWMRDHGEKLYNITAGDDTQIRASDETRQKMRDLMTGRVITWGHKISATKRNQPRLGGRRPKLFTHRGYTLTLEQWAERVNIEPGTVRYRLKSGWTFEQAVDPNCKSVVRPKYYFNGENLTCAEWANRLGINPATLWTRLNDPTLTIEEALTTPVRIRRKLQ